MALTPEQIDGLKETFGKIAQPINEWLLQDAARRIRQAAEYAGETGGKMTRTAAYELWRAKAMGESEREMKAFMRRQLGLSNKEIRRLFRQAARFSRDNDEERVGLTGGADIAQMTAAAIQLAQKDFTNLTQTLGMMTPGGKVQPLRRFYQETMDFAFEQVFTGAADYQTALRQATTKMADAGVRTIDYASGRSISIEAAVRRNLMGGMGLLDEQITKANHDALGCNGWEITAHRNSAPDHEPYQGKQFSDAEWAKLNGTPEKPGILKRRIETLNCNHHAMPIILGVNAPQYTDAELAAMREENAKGITYEGRHYTGYEATQKQRQIERNMRTQKNRILVSEQLEDKTKKQTAQIRLQILRGHYKAFSKAAGLPLQEERAWVAGFGRKRQKLHEQTYAGGIGSPRTDLNYIESEEYKAKFSSISDNPKLNRAIYERCKAAVTHQSGKFTEDLSIIDLQGNLIGTTSSKVAYETQYSQRLKRAVLSAEPYSLVSIHDHGTNVPPSGADFGSAGSKKYAFGIVACHDGRVYYYSTKKARPFTARFYDETVDKFRKSPYNYDEMKAYIETLKQFEIFYGIEWREL